MQDDRADRGVGSPLDLSAGLAGLPFDPNMLADAEPTGLTAWAQLGDLDVAARGNLAKRLAARPDLPRPVALALARDKIVVAYPILRYGPVLADSDLALIVEESSRDHHLAIAGRTSLSPSVTAILVEMSEADVLVQLLRNPGAMFTEYVFRRLVAASRHAAMLRTPVLARRELTLEMAQDLSRWVGPDLRRRIAERFGPEAVLTLLDSAASVEPRPTPQPAAEVAAARMRPRAHPLVEAVRRDDRRLLETALAEMSGLPRFAVLRIVTDPGAEALAVVCRGLALKRRLFAAIYERLHEGQTRSRDMATESFRGALAYFNRLRSPQAASILQGWRKAPITVWQSSRTWTSQTWLGPGDQAA